MIKLNRQYQGAKLAPHKPLLLLLAIGSWQQKRLLNWLVIKEELGLLLVKFGGVSNAKPVYPFIRLQNDGWWEVEGYEGLKGDATVPELDRANPKARLSHAFQSEFLTSKSSLQAVVKELLSEFEESVHQELLNAVGIDLNKQNVKPMLRANLPPGLEASDIQAAAEWIDQNSIPGKREAEKWAIIVNDKEYPPPYLGQVAVQLKTGELVENQALLRAGSDMFNTFKNLGFRKVKKGSAKVHIGKIQGLVPGDRFEDRRELMETGVHRSIMYGIDGNKKVGAGAIVLSGGYEDDLDNGDEIIYTGEGGRNDKKKQVADQTWESNGNASLKRSYAQGLPVRVIRGAAHKGPHSPKSGYVYGGLYIIEQAWIEEGKSGFKICRFKLERCDEAPLAEQQKQSGFVVREPGARYAKSTIVRRVRDTQLSRQVKELYDHCCQVCGLRIETPGGPYSEGAHIKPIGTPHLGDDRPENLLCLCPNHHVMFDRGGFGIADDFTFIGIEGELHLHEDHEIDIDNARYHRNMHGLNQIQD